MALHKLLKLCVVTLHWWIENYDYRFNGIIESRPYLEDLQTGDIVKFCNMQHLVDYFRVIVYDKRDSVFIDDLLELEFLSKYVSMKGVTL